MVMDPHYQLDEEYPLEPSLMPKSSDDNWNTVLWQLNTGENMQTSYELPQNSLAEPTYPLHHETPLLKYTTGHQIDSGLFTVEESDLRYQGPFAKSSPPDWVDCQVNGTPALRPQHRVQFSHQLRQQGDMVHHSSSMMIPNHGTVHCAGCHCQHSLGVVVSRAQCPSPHGAAEQQTSMLSPPPLSQSYSPSTSGCASPKLSPIFAFAPSPSPESPTPAARRPPTDTQSPVDNKKQFVCNECNMAKKDFKSYDRHFIEKHCKPPDGQPQQGWFRCACGFTSCYYRKGNYTRHLKTCKPHKWVLREFVCQCLVKHTDKDLHAAHYDACNIGRRRAGRPPHAV